MAQITYGENNIGSGIWEYSLTVANTSDPVLDAGVDIYDLFFYDPSESGTVVSLPTDWDNILGTGFIDTFSLYPGATPLGSDIAPGAVLSGFVFQFNGRVGPLAFDVLFVNPTGGDPLSYSGATSSASTPIPEPSTLLLLSAGVGILGWTKRRLVSRG
jgi:hypothetical protein